MIDKKKLAGIVLAGVLMVAGTTSAFAADVTNDTKVPFHRQLFKIDKTEIVSKIKSAIDSLVSAGTITKEQADAISKYFPPMRVKFDDKLIKRNPMSELITAGTITQAQADEIGKEMKAGIANKKTMDEIFNGLVTAGTITEAQKEAVQKAIPARPGKFINKERFSKDDIRKGTFKKPVRTPLDELITAGTITQAQADAVNSAIKAAIKPSAQQQ